MVLALGASALSSSVARAAAARLEYRAPEGCPAQAGFVSAVEARGASLERAADGAPRLLRVLIERADGGFSGSLQVGEGAAASGARRVHAATCAEVSDALAVVAAIALEGDPEAGSAPVSAVPVDSGASSAPRAVSVAPAPAVSVTTLATPVGPKAPRLQTVMGEDSVEVEAGKLSFGNIVRYTLSAGAALGVVPHLTLPRFDFSISSARLVSAPGERDFLVGSVLRVRWTFLGPAEYHSAGFDTRVVAIKAGIGACTPLTYDPDGLVLELCSEIAAGAAGLETRDAAGNKVQSKTSIGIGTASFELHSQYNLGAALYVDLNLGGEMWMSKLSAESPDGNRLFRSSTFNAYALAGLGLRF